MNQDYDDFTKGIIKMSLVSIAAAVLAGLRGGIFTNVNQRLNMRIRKKLFKSLVFQDISFFDEIKTGNIQVQCSHHFIICNTPNTCFKVLLYYSSL